jgi:hypothetical protein
MNLSSGTTSVGIFFNTAQTYTGPQIRGKVQELYRDYYLASYKIWDEGNDGSGSGLDADLLDGNHASDFVLKSGDTMTGALILPATGALHNLRYNFTSGQAASRNWFVGNDVSAYGSFNISTETAQGNNTLLSRFHINAAGNIGVGTSAPLNKLELRVTGGDSNNGIMITREDATTTTNEILGGIGFDSTDGNVPSSILEASAYIAAFAAEDHSVGDKGGYLTFGTAPIDQDDDTVSIERMRITSTGNVGIGTTAPDGKLTLIADTASNNGASFRIQSASGATRNLLFMGASSTQDASHIQSYKDGTGAGVKNLLLNPLGGNVGIGTTSPLYKLHIENSGGSFAVTNGSSSGLKLHTWSSSVNIDPTIENNAFRFGRDTSLSSTTFESGNVGIGTDNPQRLLNIQTSVPSESYIRIAGLSNNVIDANFAGIEFFNTDASSAGPNVASFIEARAFTSLGAGASLVFGTMNASGVDGTRAVDRMKIDGNGLVGVNEFSPAAQLQVKSGAVGRVPLIVDTLASQTANLAEFKLNTATRLVVTKDGKLQAGSGDGEIHVTTQGVRIETLADNAFVPLTVNKDDNNTSAYLQQWQSATNTVAYVDETGEFYAPAFISINGANSGSLGLQGSPFISRNINDATTTLTVNNANASSTGNLLDLQAAGTNIISFKKDGTLLAPATFTIDPSGHGDITGKVIILGDLQVDGTTTTINSTTLEVDDKNIELSKGATNKEASDGAGITVDLGTDGTASLLYGSTNDIFSFNKGLSVGGQLSVSSADFPPLSSERSTFQTNILQASGLFKHKTTADMADGFGTNIAFAIEDNALVNNVIGSIGASRIGADNSGRMVFLTNNAGTTTEKMTIMPDGKMGIGTSNPQATLSINSGTANTYLQITNTDSGNTLNDGLNIFQQGLNSKFINRENGSMAFETNNSEKMRITATGNVGIGTGAPATKLSVITDTNGDSLQIRRNSTTANDYATLGFRISTADGGNFSEIRAVRTNRAVTADTDLRFITFSNSNFVQAMTIRDDGNVGIGTTSPLAKLDVTNQAVTLQQSTANNSFIGLGSYFDGTKNRASGSTYFGFGIEVDRPNQKMLLSAYDSSGILSSGANSITLLRTGNVGIGTTSPSTRLSINAIAATGTRENILDATVSDDINSRFIISNGTITDGVFAPSFGGISNSTIHWGLKFTGFTTAANDASNSSNFGLVDFEVLRTDSTTNPFNGTLSNVVNRRAFTFRNGTSNLMTIMSSGNVGIGTNAPGELLDVRGNLRVGGSSTSNYIAFHGTTGDNPAGFNHGYIGERIFSGTESSELVIFKGNDVEGAPGPDRIRHIAANHLFDTYGSALSGTFAEVSASSVPTTKMIITQVGNVGIGTTTPSALLTVNNGESNGAFAVQGLATNDYIATFRDSDGENVFKASGSVADSDLVVAFGDVNDAGSAVNYRILSDKHVFSGSVGIGTSSSALSDALTVNGSAKVGSLKIDDIHVQDTATVTTTATTQTVLATYAVATYATGKFLIQATSGGNRHISELLVTHNGTVSTATEYAILKTAGNLFTVTTDISGGNVRILVTSASATSTVYRTTFTLIGV